MSRSDRTNLDRRTLLRTGTLAGLAFTLVASGAARAEDSAPLKIGVIGSGHIGSTVGSLWVKAGHPVMFSSRHPEELASLVQTLGPLAKAGTVAQAIAFGDVVFLAVPYGAYPELGKEYGSALAGKIVLDAGNAVAARDGDITNEAKQQGIGLTTAKYLPGARIVRAFNTMSYKLFASESNRPGDRMAIPIAGDDKQALDVASKLVHDAGFDPVIIGPLSSAKEFAQGAPLYGQQLTAAEMRQKADALK